ncbi:hypothetical protein K2P97_13220 [bacterium]|nr:hypothetical protein [bacterium]
MKYFLIVFLFGTFAFSKNKIVYIEKQSNPKVPPNFYAIPDFKKPSSRKLIDNDIGTYTSTDDYIVYQKGEQLYIITDFDTYNKILVSDNVVDYRTRKGMLLYTRVINNTNTVFAITDFKTLSKIEVISNFISYNIDEAL